MHMWNLGNIPKFGGTLSENVENWLENFEWIANANMWNDNMKSIQLPLYFDFSAKSWYNSLDMEIKKNFTMLKGGLILAFKRTEPVSHYFQELTERKQLENEAVDAYAYEKLALCTKVNRHMQENDRIQHFIHGLLPQIKGSVIISDPQNFIDALSSARKQENALRYSKEAKTLSSPIIESNLGLQLISDRLLKIEDHLKSNNSSAVTVRKIETEDQSRHEKRKNQESDERPRKYVNC